MSAENPALEPRPAWHERQVVPITLVVLWLLLVTLVVVYTPSYSVPELGVSRAEVIESMGTPTFSYQIGNGELLVYNRSVLNDDNDDEYPKDVVIGGVGELPYTYESHRLLLNSRGEFVGHCQLGESYYVRTVEGNFKGDTFCLATAGVRAVD